jgi:hypothetical protein
MNRDDLNNIILKSLTEELNQDERKVLQKEALPDYSFTDDFAKKVIVRIESERFPVYLKYDFMKYFDRGFRRVALTGVAAIIILIVSLVLSQGSLSYDTLLGIDNNVDDSLISLLVEK